jgi:Rad3-related DNA helicase
MTKLARAPKNLIESYPAESWRPNQLDYCKTILAVVQQPGDHRIGLEGPCGSGKSIGYLRAAMDPRCPPVVVLSTTRQHLAQIEATLQAHWPDGAWAVLRGRTHYGCCDGGSDAGRALDQADPDPGAEHAQVGKCPLGEDCRYRAAVVRCGTAKVVVQCTIGHLYRREFWAASDPNAPGCKDPELAAARRSIVDREVVILDEAHEYVKVRRSFESSTLGMYARTWLRTETQRALQAARVQPRSTYRAGYVVLTDPRHAGLVAAVTADLDRVHANLARELDQASDERAMKRLTTQKTKVETRLAILRAIGTEDSKNRCVSLQFGGADGQFVDMVTEPIRAYTQDKLARVEVFTSATLAPVSRLLGIEDQWVKLFPEIFDWAGSVKLMALPDENPGSRANVAIDADTVAALYETPGRPQTILLAFSKAHAASMVARIRNRASVYLQGADAEETLSELVDRAKADPNAFLVTYGGWVGVDMPGQKWLIIGSVPKSPLSAAVEARAAAARKSPWNDYERNALDRLQLAQGLGRALRTAQDRAVLIWQNNQSARDAGINPQTGRLT